MFTTYVRFVSVRGQLGVHVIVIGQPSGRVIGLSSAIKISTQEKNCCDISLLQNQKVTIFHAFFPKEKGFMNKVIINSSSY